MKILDISHNGGRKFKDSKISKDSLKEIFDILFRCEEYTGETREETGGATGPGEASVTSLTSQSTAGPSMALRKPRKGLRARQRIRPSGIPCESDGSLLVHRGRLSKAIGRLSKAKRSMSTTVSYQ